MDVRKRIRKIAEWLDKNLAVVNPAADVCFGNDVSCFGNLNNGLTWRAKPYYLVEHACSNTC